MDVLVVEEVSANSAEWVQRLRAKGCRVHHCVDVASAIQQTHVQHFDLLIAALLLGEESTLSVVMAAQYHNPEVATILLSDALIFAQGELFGMLTSLRYVIGKPAPVQDLIEIASYLMRQTGFNERAKPRRVIRALDKRPSRVRPRRVTRSVADQFVARIGRSSAVLLRMRLPLCQADGRIGFGSFAVPNDTLQRGSIRISVYGD